MQASSDKCAIADVDEQLEAEVTGDASGGVVDCLGHHVETALAGEGDETVAKILPADEHEKREHDDDACFRRIREAGMEI